MPTSLILRNVIFHIFNISEIRAHHTVGILRLGEVPYVIILFKTL